MIRAVYCVPVVMLFACNGEPRDLIEAGLYCKSLDTVCEDAEAYAPSFELWSDGAAKERHLVLPDAIDTSSPDHWVFPVGTKAFKTFLVDGVRVETRMLHKADADRWTSTTYLWSEDGSEATKRKAGKRDAVGTDHDVPRRGLCNDCHDGASDTLLGISAVQLYHAGGSLDLQALEADGRVTDVIPRGATVLDDAALGPGLGYLHANCGSCHNSDWLNLTVPSGSSSIEWTGFYQTALDVKSDNDVEGATHLALSGNPKKSEIWQRMKLRDHRDQMPPIASDVVDKGGVDLVGNLIEAMGSGGMASATP